MKPLPFIAIGLVVFVLATKSGFAPPPPPRMYITEIMYNSPEQEDSLNFIEFTATGWYQNLSDLIISGLINEFPDSSVGTFIGGTQILVVQDSVAFENVYGITAFQWESFSNLDLSVPIVIEGQYFTDSFNLNSTMPFANHANGFGHSIERCLDNAEYEFHVNQTSSGIELNGVTVFANPGGYQWPLCSPVDVSAPIIESEFKLFPNPNSGTFTLDYSQLQENATLRIRNMMSQILFERQVNKGSQRLTQNVKFNKGVYLLELDDGNRCQHQYMVITD